VAYKWLCPILLLLFFCPVYGAGATSTTEDVFYQGNVELYPKPAPSSSVKREAVITPSRLSIAYREFPEAREGTENKGVHIRITAVEWAPEPAAKQTGLQALRMSTLWKNVHPKQKIDRKSLEKKADRTMGAGGMFAGRAKGDSSAGQQSEKDVAYKIPEWGNHLFLLVDGIAYSIDVSSAELNHGADPSGKFIISRQGQEQEVQFLFRIPVAAKNMALQFFDNANGHIQILLSGDPHLARGSGYPEGLIDQAKAGDLELGIVSVMTATGTQEPGIPEGWKRLTVGLAGKSNARKGGGATLAQIDTEEYVWLEGDGGFTFNVWPSNRGRKQLRFTPEYYSMESISFLVPGQLLSFRLAVRNGSEVSTLNLSEKAPLPPPVPYQSFMDGDVAECSCILLPGQKTRPLWTWAFEGLTWKKALKLNHTGRFVCMGRIKALNQTNGEPRP